MEIKYHEAQLMETQSGANVVNVNPKILILKAFATWKPMIFYRLDLKVVMFNIAMKLFFEVFFFFSTIHESIRSLQTLLLCSSILFLKVFFSFERSMCFLNNEK